MADEARAPEPAGGGNDLDEVSGLYECVGRTEDPQSSGLVTATLRMRGSPPWLEVRGPGARQFHRGQFYRIKAWVPGA